MLSVTAITTTMRTIMKMKLKTMMMMIIVVVIITMRSLPPDYANQRCMTICLVTPVKWDT